MKNHGRNIRIWRVDFGIDCTMKPYWEFPFFQPGQGKGSFGTFKNETAPVKQIKTIRSENWFIAVRTHWKIERRVKKIRRIIKRTKRKVKIIERGIRKC